MYIYIHMRPLLASDSVWGTFAIWKLTQCISAPESSTWCAGAQSCMDGVPGKPPSREFPRFRKRPWIQNNVSYISFTSSIFYYVTMTWHEQHSGKVCRHTPVTYYNIIIAQPPNHDSSTCSTWPCATKAQGIVADHALASCWNRKQKQMHGKYVSWVQTKYLKKTACCNHILSGRKSRGMSHLNQTSESLWGHH